MTWKDLTVSQFINLSNIKVSEFNSVFEFKKEMVSICFDKSISELEDMDVEEFEELERGIDSLIEIKDGYLTLALPSLRNKTSVIIEDHKFTFIDNFNYITLAEWIDLDFYRTNDYFNNFTKILAILYRIKEENNSILFPDVFEPYGLYARHRAPLFLDLKIDDVYGAVQKYTQWREGILNKYQGLFKGPSELDNDKDLTEEESSLLTETEKKQIKGEIEREKKVAKWNVEVFLKNITANNIVEVEALLKLNVNFVLNWKSADIEIGAN